MNKDHPTLFYLDRIMLENWNWDFSKIPYILSVEAKTPLCVMPSSNTFPTRLSTPTCLLALAFALSQLSPFHFHTCFTCSKLFS